MNEAGKISFDQQVYYRLIALWVLCEAFLGGIIHGLKIPVSGLVVGSGAILCICLIAYYVPVKGAIIKATIIVAVFKMMLSPHTPPTAYIAVFFQGAVGQLLFINQKYFRISCIILGLLAMVESAIQRILVLVILYGSQFWNAVDQYISRLTNHDVVTNYSQLIAMGYVLLHAVVGVFVGWFAGRLAVRSEKWNMQHKYLIDYKVGADAPGQSEKPSKRKRLIRFSFIIIWLVLIVIFVQSAAITGTPILPSNIALQILLRSLLIVLTWYFFLGPLVLLLMKKWLKKQKDKKQSDIQQVMLLLPSTKYLVRKSWQLTEGSSRWERIRSFLKIVLINLLQNKNVN